MTRDERFAEHAEKYGVMSQEESERLRQVREEVQRKHEEKWGPTDPDAEVNVRKWRDPVELRVVRPAPAEQPEDGGRDA